MKKDVDFLIFTKRRLQILVKEDIWFLIIIFKQHTQMVEINLQMIISENLHLINAVDRNIKKPLNRKYGKIPFNIQ